MDYVGHFLREVAAFEAAGRVAAGFEAAPVVPSCPGWVVTNLVLHLGVVHRVVARVIDERMQQPPGRGDRSWLGLAEDWRGWLPPGRAPQRSQVPAGLLGWFHAGAADLQERFRAADGGEQVWTWSADHTVGFWQRMQAIEAAVHRWGTPGSADRSAAGRCQPSAATALQAAPADLVQVATGSVGGVHAILVERRVVANAERGPSGKAGGVAAGLAHRGQGVPFIQTLALLGISRATASHPGGQ